MNYDIKNDEIDKSGMVGVVCIDINSLKFVNDTNGHLAGDELIKNAASHIVNTLKGRAYRAGGDEFVVIKEQASEEKLQEELERLRTLMSKDGISIAIGSACRHCTGSIEELINEADKAMYKNKAEFYSRAENDRRRR